MAGATPVRLTLVYATWCPHCYPLSTELAPQLADGLHVPLHLLDIDTPAEEREADRLVESHGDWDPDYLIPQLFLEWSDGGVTHLLTGVPGSLEGTRARWMELLADRQRLAGRASA